MATSTGWSRRSKRRSASPEPMAEIERATIAHFDDPAFAAVNVHPFTGEFGRRYYPAVFGDQRGDESFLIRENGKAALLVVCAAGDGALDWYGLPIRFFPRAGAPVGRTAVEAALTRLDALAKKHGARAITLHETPALALAELCRARGYAPSERDYASADLAGGEAGLRKTLRKSFKSLIN